jgi:hypothetical protein
MRLYTITFRLSLPASGAGRGQAMMRSQQHSALDLRLSSALEANSRLWPRTIETSLPSQPLSYNTMFHVADLFSSSHHGEMSFADRSERDRAQADERWVPHLMDAGRFVSID